jgi:nitrogen fixation protein FixH
VNDIPTVPSRGRFTGRDMLLIMFAFFGIIIAVNVTMAWYAMSSWSGLVVDDTYVASQQFNKKADAMRAMAASGISGETTIHDGVIAYTLRNRDGSPAIAEEVTVHFKRPVGAHEDFEARLSKSGEGRFELAHGVLPGDWIVEITSKRGESTIMHEAYRIYVDGGNMQ